MKHTITLGKIDYNNSNRPNCKVTIDIELKETHVKYDRLYSHADFDANKIHYVLSICGNIWNPRETDCYSCGQNLDEIGTYFLANKNVQRLIAIWKEYHLNDLQAGCECQQQGDYSNPAISGQVCPITGYKYGSGWLYKELPDSIITEIHELIAILGA